MVERINYDLKSWELLSMDNTLKSKSYLLPFSCGPFRHMRDAHHTKNLSSCGLILDTFQVFSNCLIRIKAESSYPIVTMHSFS